MFLGTCCGLQGEDAANAADILHRTTSPEEDQCSSYATGDSDEEAPPEIHTNSVSDAWIERLEKMKSCIATLDAT